MEESPVKKVLKGLRTYLHNNLRIDKDFIAGLLAEGLLGDSNADSLRSSVTQGGNEALYSLLHYIEWFYDEEMLEKFCVFLDDCSKNAKPIFREIAARIRSELEIHHQPDAIHQPRPQKQDSSSTTPLGQDQNHLYQELTVKENIIHQKDVHLREQTAALKQQHTLLQQKDAQLKQKDVHLREQTAALKQQHTLLQQKDAQLKQKDVQRRQLRAKLQQQTAQLREQDVELKQQHTLLQRKDAQLKQKDAELRHKDEESGRQYAILLHENQQLQQERDQLRRERDQLQRESSRSLSAKPVVKKPPRNWKDMKCQKILKCGGVCRFVDIKGNHIAVAVPNSIKVFDKSSTDLLHTIGKGQLGDYLPGVTYYDQEHILVSDYDNDNIKMFTIQGRHVRTIDRGSTTFQPKGITISPDGHIYVCDEANDCVCVFDVNGKFLLSFGSHGSDDECFNYPGDLCFASDGFLYITDVGNSRICVCDKDGKFIRKFTTTYLPWCIGATDCGHLIVSSFGSDKVMIYTTGGDLVHVFGEQGSKLGQFDRPTGVSVDSDGLIYIADFINHRIQVF